MLLLSSELGSLHGWALSSNRSTSSLVSAPAHDLPRATTLGATAAHAGAQKTNKRNGATAHRPRSADERRRLTTQAVC